MKKRLFVLSTRSLDFLLLIITLALFTYAAFPLFEKSHISIPIYVRNHGSVDSLSTPVAIMVSEPYLSVENLLNKYGLQAYQDPYKQPYIWARAKSVNIAEIGGRLGLALGGLLAFIGFKRTTADENERNVKIVMTTVDRWLQFPHTPSSVSHEIETTLLTLHPLPDTMRRELNRINLEAKALSRGKGGDMTYWDTKTNRLRESVRDTLNSCN